MKTTKPILLLFTFLFLSSLTNAQTIKEEGAELGKTKQADPADTLNGWRYAGMLNLNFTQTALTNWAAGGTGSYALLGSVNLQANYKKDSTLLWENTLNLNYGMVKADGSLLQKNDDRIELVSRAGRQAFGNWYYTVFGSFKTQFDATFKENEMVSNFMSPAWMQFALGLTYTKDERFSILLAPIAGKFTFVNDQRLADSGDYGVEKAILDPVTFSVLTPGKRFRSEIGAYIFMTSKLELMKNVTLMTRLDLFNNYTDKNKPNRKNIDVNWETTVNMKINAWLSASLFTHLIYDNDILIPLTDRPGEKGPRTQFKQVLGVGLAYKFG